MVFLKSYLLGTIPFLENVGNWSIEGLSGIVETQHETHYKLMENHRKLRPGQSTTKAIDVPCYTLNGLLDLYDIKQIDYLSVDTEGAEREILLATDFNKFKIGVIEFEENYPEMTREIHPYLISKGYTLWKRIANNCIYVHCDYPIPSKEIKLNSSKNLSDSSKYNHTLAGAIMVKNEEKFIAKTVESLVKFCDRVVLLDTGSTDRTIEIVREVCSLAGIPLHWKQVIQNPEKAPLWWQKKIEERGLASKDYFDYSKSRNELLLLGEDKADYLVILDANEVAENGHYLRNYLSTFHSKFYGGGKALSKNTLELESAKDNILPKGFLIPRCLKLDQQPNTSFKVKVFTSPNVIKTGQGLKYIYPLHEVLVDSQQKLLLNQYEEIHSGVVLDLPLPQGVNDSGYQAIVDEACFHLYQDRSISNSAMTSTKKRLPYDRILLEHYLEQHRLVQNCYDPDYYSVHINLYDTYMQLQDLQGIRTAIKNLLQILKLHLKDKYSTNQVVYNLVKNLSNVENEIKKESSATRSKEKAINLTYLSDEIALTSGNYTHTLAGIIMLKNEASCVQKTIESMLEVCDSIVLLDTGSTDDTIQVVQQACSKVGKSLHYIQVIQDPPQWWLERKDTKEDMSYFDFSEGRNLLLKLADDKADYLLLCDANDVLQNAKVLRPCLEKLHRQYLTREDKSSLWQAHAPILWKNDSGVATRWEQRIIKTKQGLKYYYPVHEILLSAPPSKKLKKFEGNPSQQEQDILKLEIGFCFYQDRTDSKAIEPSKKRLKRDEIMLEHYYSENERQGYEDVHIMYYLTQTYMELAKLDKAYDISKAIITLLVKKGLEKEYKDFLYQLELQCGVIAYRKGLEWNTVVAPHFLKAYHYNFNRVEPLLKLAMYYMEQIREDQDDLDEQTRWHFAYMYAHLAAKCSLPTEVLGTIYNHVYAYLRWHVLSIAR